MNKLLVTLGLSALLLGGCAEQGCLRVLATTPLLEKPYPQDYPSTNPQPNRVLVQLGPGEYPYESIVDGKDFRAYGVRSGDSIQGYVIHDRQVDLCQ